MPGNIHLTYKWTTSIIIITAVIMENKDYDSYLALADAEPLIQTAWNVTLTKWLSMHASTKGR